MNISSCIQRQLAHHHMRKQLRCLYSSIAGDHLSLSSIRSQLSEFKGGEVTLTSAGSHDSIAVISASHPQRKNAFTGSMCVSLYDVIQELTNDNTRKAVILRGLNKMFCSGADLTMAKQIADSTNGERFSRFMQTALSNLQNLPFPSYALLQGNVLGGGAELVVACDQAIATSNTNIYFVQGKMGIVPGWAAATHLVRKVGYHRALDMLLSSQTINSDYAKSIGLIDHIINDTSILSDEELLYKGLEVIDTQLGHLPLDVIRGIKSVAFNASRLSYGDSIAHERQVFKSLWGAEANLNALESNLKHVK